MSTKKAKLTLSENIGGFSLLDAPMPPETSEKITNTFSYCAPKEAHSEIEGKSSLSIAHFILLLYQLFI
jgi:hypothetical protein